MTGMDALDTLRQQGNDTAIVADVVVVGALAIFGLAAGNEVLNAERHVAGVGYAVDYNEFDGLQWFHNYRELVFLEPVRCTGLHCEGTGDGGYDCSEEFKDLCYVVPIYFYHKAKFKI